MPAPQWVTTATMMMPQPVMPAPMHMPVTRIGSATVLVSPSPQPAEPNGKARGRTPEPTLLGPFQSQKLRRRLDKCAQILDQCAATAGAALDVKQSPRSMTATRSTPQLNGRSVRHEAPPAASKGGQLNLLLSELATAEAALKVSTKAAQKAQQALFTADPSARRRNGRG